MPKLLIVDDEEDIREFASHFFKKREIETFTASGGKEALEVIGAESPDLVLLDVRMEEITGVEVLRQLRQEKNNIKVIMVTGMEDEETINATKELGISGFIHKPLVLEELKEIVLKELGKE